MLVLAVVDWFGSPGTDVIFRSEQGLRPVDAVIASKRGRHIGQKWMPKLLPTFNDYGDTFFSF